MHYISLRPKEYFTDRFFVQYKNGKCTKQVNGKNTETYCFILGLENPEDFTDHCFRRTSATLLSDSGASLQLIKQLCGWLSDAVALRYIENSMKSKEIFLME